MRKRWYYAVSAISLLLSSLRVIINKQKFWIHEYVATRSHRETYWKTLWSVEEKKKKESNAFSKNALVLRRPRIWMQGSSFSKIQFVIFKPLSCSFEETIGFDVKASFASRPVSRLFRWYNKPGDITKEFWWKAIQFYGTFHGLKITNWISLRLEKTGKFGVKFSKALRTFQIWNMGSLWPYSVY